MEYAEISFRSEMIGRARVERLREQRIETSYLTWQMGPCREVSFSKYLSDFGLLDKVPKMSDAHKAAIVRKTEALAERILAADRKRKK